MNDGYSGNMPYTILSEYYDRLMTDYDYTYAAELIRPYAAGKVLDAGCGSGTVSIAMARMGADVTAMDRSQQMLRVASDKASRAGLKIRFIQGDITATDCEIGRGYALVTCMCDVFNYITGDTLLHTALTNINRALKDGGALIFDISSQAKLLRLAEAGQYYMDKEDFTYLWTNRLHGDILEMEIAFFERSSGNIYRRYDELHRQRIYDVDTMSRHLERAGFESQADSSVNRDRYYFKARKVRSV